MNTRSYFASYRLQKILLKRAGLWYHTGRDMKGRVTLCCKVRCYECGKTYDYDTDDFCPKCGAFNQPPKSTTIDANGAVIRVDGINERGHAGSFVHEELHEENRERKRMGLSKGTRRTAAAAPQPSVQRTASRQSGRQSGKAQPAVAS